MCMCIYECDVFMMCVLMYDVWELKNQWYIYDREWKVNGGYDL